MKAKERKRSLPMPLLLVLTYVGFVVARSLLAVAAQKHPTILIDELLYAHIARSLARGTGILYMGQPANYTSILYPLVLSPVYALFPDGSNYYVLMQVWNALLINLSLFPIYALAKAIAHDERKGYLTALVSLILPDLFMNCVLMSENILYPMFFALMYCGYQYMQQPKLRHMVWVGILGGLIFFTKPGQVVPAAAILLAALICVLKAREYRRLLHVGAGVLALVLIMLLSYVLVFRVLNHPAGTFGIYGNQMSPDTTSRMDMFFSGLALTPYYFCLCAGAVCFALLYYHKGFSGPDRVFLWVCLGSMAAITLGTAWIINRIEYSNYSVHTRYIAMYIPVLLAFALAVDRSDRLPVASDKLPGQMKESPAGWVLAAYMAVCSAVFGCRAGISSNSTPVFNLGATFLRSLSPVAGVIVSVLIAAAAVLAAWKLPGMRKKGLQRVCIGFLVLFSVINNCEAYSYHGTNTFAALVESNREAREVIGDKPYLYIAGYFNKLYGVWLDVNSRNNTQILSLSDLADGLRDTDGVYRPFVPTLQRGTIPQNLTPDTDLIVIDQDAWACMELSEDVEFLSPAGKMLTVIRIPKDKPWIKSLMAGTKQGGVTQGQRCGILIFDETVLQSSVKFALDIELMQASEFRVYYTTEKYYSFNLPAGRDRYTINISAPASTIYLQVMDSDAHVYGYSLNR